MPIGPTLFRVAALCGALSALTTLGVHLLPSLYAGADTFETQLLLRESCSARAWASSP